MARLPDTDGVFPINIFRVLGHAPPTEKGFVSMGTRLLSETTLDAKTRELVIDAVSVKLDAPYEWSHHAKPALEAGATPDDLQALIDGDLTRLDPTTSAAIAFALKVDDAAVTDADVASLRDAGFDERQVVELTVLAGYYGMVARFLLAMDVSVDEGNPADFTIPT